MDEPVTTNEVLPSFFIDRDLVDEYCGSKGLDVYSLLQECVDFGISGFLDFLSKKGIHISIRGNNAKAILHGSGKVISEFERAIKEAAIDCTLFKKGNVFQDEEDIKCQI